MLSDYIVEADDVIEITEYTRYTSEVEERPQSKTSLLDYISSDNVLLIGLAYLLSQDKDPDYLTIIALIYILL